jgi:D-glycero-alpha-D-manno-heptose-7-phosphate kinase
MIIRSKAPLRLGLAGGGSDLSPYSNLYGGHILNATINLYAYCTIVDRKDNRIEFIASDIAKKEIHDKSIRIETNGELDLHKGVYNRIISDFELEPLSFSMTTYSDAPPGSGLGSSSTMIVAMVKAFTEWLNLPLGEYEIAHLAYKIERKDLKLSGGKQDQYAATFGGFNFMEFHDNERVIINPLRIKRWIVDEMELSIILYYTGASRSSATIIDEQVRNTSSGQQTAIDAMHSIKKSSTDMKEALLKGDIDTFASILGQSWENKKRMANSITNPQINNIFDVALNAGAKTGKVSGAGGGGYIIFVVNPVKRMDVIKALKKLNGVVTNFQFSEGGCHSWKIYND